MSSKAKLFAKCRWILALTALSFATVSCNLPLHESPPAQPPTNAELGYDTTCLQNSVPVVKAFFNGTAQAKDVTSTWNCFSGAIDLFQRKVKGATPGQYTPRELANFFEDYFLDPNTKISDTLLGEVMLLKQILIGGSNTALTIDELKKLEAWSDEARDLSLNLLPSMGVLTMNWHPQGGDSINADIQTFEAANTALQNAATVIGTRIAQNGQPYDLTQLPTLLQQVELLFQTDWPVIDQLQKALPLVEQLKQALVGGDAQTIQAGEWLGFGLLSGRGYIQYLRYYYFIEHTPDASRGWNIAYLTDSINDLFSYLGDMVRQKPSGVLTEAELYNLIQAFKPLYPDLNVSQTLLDQVMKVKQLFFGGSATQFLPAEFDNARAEIQSLNNVTQAAWPYLNLYLLEWQQGTMSNADARSNFQQGETALLNFGSGLGGLLQTSYDLNDLQILAQELGKTFPTQPGGTNWIGLVQQYLPIAVSAKNIALQTTGSVVPQGRWSDLLTSGGGLYARLMFYHYFLSGSTSWTNGQGLSDFSSLVGSAVNVVEQMIQRRKTQVIQTSELNALVTAVGAAQILPDGLSVASIQSIVPVVLQRFLTTPQVRLAGGAAPTGLTVTHLEYAKSQFANWVAGQQFVDKVYPAANSPSLSGAQVLTAIHGQPASSIMTELQMSLTTPEPLALDPGGRLFISPKQTLLYDAASISRLNLARVIADLVIQGYASDLSRIQTYQGINVTEANQLFTDAKPLAVEIGLIDASNTSFASSRFREANLFMPHADGNDLVGFAEGTDLTLMILSGLQLNSSLEQSMRDTCAVTANNPEQLWNLTATTVNTRCFLSTYRQQFAKVFTSMPVFAAYAAAMPSGLVKNGTGPVQPGEMLDFENMMMNFLKATGWTDDGSGNIRLSDLALVPHVMQYIEMMMAKYDADKNGFLDRNEAMSGYPVFRETLQAVAPAGLDTDQVLKGAFAYVLVYGKVPTTLAEKIDFIGIWIFQEDTWPVWADRKQLASVLGSITALIPKTPAAVAVPKTAGSATN